MFNKSNLLKKFEKHKIFILLSLCILLLDSIFVCLTVTQTYELVHEQEQRLANQHLRAFDITYNATKQNMLQIAHIFANDPAIQTQFLAGKRAVQQEGGGPGGEQAHKVRTQLYDMVSNNWNAFSNRFEARQLHFHLGPGSTSFLRVHKPQKFGDNMDNVRHTIVHTNANKSERTGFETGRVYSGIRGVVPVYAINEHNEKEHVGALESGSSFGIVIDNVAKSLAIDAAVVLYKEHLQKSVWPDYLDKILDSNFTHEDFVVEQTSNQQINTLLPLRVAFEKEKPVDEVQFQTIQIDDRSYLFAEKRLRDYLGTIDPSEPDAGKIIVWDDTTHIYDLARKDIITNVIFAVMAFIILEILIFYIVKFATRRLQKLVDRQTAQIQCRNTVLEGLTHHQPIKSIFSTIIQHIDEQNDAFIHQLCLIDASNKQIQLVAAPNLPVAFTSQCIADHKSGENEAVIVNDDFFSAEPLARENIAASDLSDVFKRSARETGLNAYYVYPIHSDSGETVAVMVVYSREVALLPDDKHIDMVRRASSLINLAIDRNEVGKKLRLFAKVFEQSQEAINITDANGVIVDVNPAFSLVTGFSKQEIINKKPSVLSSGRHDAAFYKDMWRSLGKTGSWFGDVWNRKKDGTFYAEKLSISTITDDAGEPVNYVGIFHDITHKKLIQEQFEKMAHYDVLTQLPNRALMEDLLKQAMSRCKRQHHSLALCFLDLDNFKPINDNFGHEVGDQLLIEISQRITSSIREGDTVSRHGGDEFILLLDNLSDESQQCIQLLQRIIDKVKVPFEYQGHALSVSVSIGYTLYPNDEVDMATLMRHADEAMYQVKQTGRNDFMSYQDLHK